MEECVLIETKCPRDCGIIMQQRALQIMKQHARGFLSHVVSVERHTSDRNKYNILKLSINN